MSKQPVATAFGPSKSPREHTAATGFPHDSCKAIEYQHMLWATCESGIKLIARQEEPVHKLIHWTVCLSEGSLKAKQRASCSQALQCSHTIANCHALKSMCFKSKGRHVPYRRG